MTIAKSCPASDAAAAAPYGTTRQGAGLAAVVDEHLDWFAAWHRLAFIVTQGRAEASLQLLPPPGFINWYKQAAEHLPHDQPVLDRLAVLHDQMHRLARLVLMKIPEGQGLAAADYDGVVTKFQGFIGGVRRLERAFAVAASGLDTLTGLRSRVGMAEDIARELERFSRTGKPFCLAILDVDHFKKVNDTYGHDAGDQVLAAVAGVISRQIRSFDDAYRLGGEEFLICLKETVLTDAVQVMERLRLALAATPVPVLGQAQALRVTASCGLVAARGQAGPEALLKMADVALYQAKHGGRNRVAVAEEA